MGYRPENVPNATENLPPYLREELNKIGAELDLGVMRNVEFLAVAPAKPREGMVRGADGTNWNPGSGKGVYVYYSNAWHILG